MATITFAATGDSIITRRISHLKDPDFLDLAALLRGADAAFNNLELPLPKEPVVPNSGKSLLSAPPYVVDELAWMGLNLFSIANNHSTDYMYTGLVDTMEALRERGVAFAGAGEDLGRARLPAYLETGAGRVALVAAATPFTTTAWGGWASEAAPAVRAVPASTRCATRRGMCWTPSASGRCRRSMPPWAPPPHRPPADFWRLFRRQAGRADLPGRHLPAGRAAGRDHRLAAGRFGRDRPLDTRREPAGRPGGREPARPRGPGQRPQLAGAGVFLVETARRWIDAGADMFIGHGPHMLRPMEMYKGKPIFYSLGNFAFMSETLERIPAEIYRYFGLTPEATPGELFDIRTGEREGKPRGFHAEPAYWEAIVPVASLPGPPSGLPGPAPHHPGPAPAARPAGSAASGLLCRRRGHPGAAGRHVAALRDGDHRGAPR